MTIKLDMSAFAGERILCAVSGGADSMCLLHLLYSGGADIIAAHYEHGIRGEESLRDARFVENWCAERGIECVVGHGDVPGYALVHGLGTEDAARRLRYEFLQSTAKERGCGLIATPYVYDSIEHQQKVFESGKLDDLFATTRDHGFVVLSAYSLGARNLYTRDKAVTTPEELAGMKIRVMGSDTCIAMMNAMGGVGVAMAQGDVYSAIQTGTLDGAENNIITYVDLVQYEVAPYYNRTGHLMIPDELCINAKVFDSMSAEDQEALKKCASESIDYMFNLCAELRSDYEAKAAEKGVIFSDADVPAFQALCQDLINDVANRTDMTKAVYEAIVSER